MSRSTPSYTPSPRSPLVNSSPRHLLSHPRRRHSPATETLLTHHKSWTAELVRAIALEPTWRSIPLAQQLMLHRDETLPLWHCHSKAVQRGRKALITYISAVFALAWSKLLWYIFVQSLVLQKQGQSSEKMSSKAPEGTDRATYLFGGLRLFEGAWQQGAVFFASQELY